MPTDDASSYVDPFQAAMQKPIQAIEKGSETLSAADPAALGSKVLQSATLGFGADAVGAISPSAGKKIRGLSDQYDKQHPMAAFGVDLAVGLAESAIPVAGEAQAGRVGALAAANPALRQAVAGSVMGGLQGLGSGGDMSQRLKHGAEGAATGAVAGGALGAATGLVRTALNRTPVADQAGVAFDSIKQALKKDGMTPEQAAAKLKANPNMRLADISPAAADLVRSASKTSQDAGRQVGDAVREDAEKQTQRAQAELQPLLPLKQKLLSDLPKMTANQQALYSQTRAEVVPVSTELKQLMAHPSVAPLIKSASEDFNASLRAGRLPGLPKFKSGQEIPTVGLDILQRKIGEAADTVGPGTEQYGTLRKLQAQLNGMAGSPALSAAQQQTAQLGAATRGQEWGGQFSKGLRTADMSEFRAMGPEGQQYARIGMVGGLEDYLRNHTRLPESRMNAIADAMDHPDVKEVLGSSTANAAKKAFKTEAARQRVNAQMASNTSKPQEFESENVARMGAHAANVVGGHAVGTVARLAASAGMSPAQAENIINIVAKPGGADQLKKAGMSKSLVDKFRAAIDTGGAAPQRALTNASLAQSK